MNRKHQHRRGPWGRLLAPIAPGLLGGCAGVQSALDAKGPAAAAIAHSHWVMLAGAVAILTLVTLMALYAVYRRPERRAPVSSTRMIVWGGVVLPVVALTALLVYGAFLMDRLRPGSAAPEGVLEVRIVARQWAWEVTYPGATPERPIMLLNELRLPAGRTVSLHLTSRDVIHSFWIPSLAGKMDVIPGHVRRLSVQADAPGYYRGQCAEFCGMLHAHMILYVIAEPAESFDAWLAGRREALSKGHGTPPGSTLSPNRPDAGVGFRARMRTHAALRDAEAASSRTGRLPQSVRPQLDPRGRAGPDRASPRALSV